MRKPQKIAGAFLEMFLLVWMSIAFAHVLNASDGSHPLTLQDALNTLLNDKTLASAQTLPTVQTCLESKNGSVCQEYTSDTCATKCASACIPSTMDKVDQCKVGSCYDSAFGTCSLRSTKESCQNQGGTWLNDPFGNTLQCKQGCCVLGNAVSFGTARQCDVLANASGIPRDFRSQVNDQLSCLALSNSQEQGACVKSADPQNDCTFTSKEKCIQTHGEFHAGILCSNPDLNTKCVAQQRAGCVDDATLGLKDEVYWFDSCGNPENIYDVNLNKSFNDGKVLPKEQSCILSSTTNPVANQKTCGNCDRYSSSVCGKRTSTESLKDSSQQYVCRSLDCTDIDGTKRANGESWCATQGSIGVDAGISTNRSSDTPGSRYYRKSCVNGDITTEPCLDYRNAICVESKNPTTAGGTFSTASCRINRGYECLGYNTVEKKAECAKNPDCFVKKVDVAANFSFDYCVPKYKPGFDLSTQSDSAVSYCGIGTATCKYISVKTLTGKNEINKECLSSKFTEQMNDFCMSLGDCGASANYLGAMSESNYEVTNAPRLGTAYLQDIARYANEKLFKGKSADVGSLADYYGMLGFPSGLGGATTPDDPMTGIYTVGMITGVVGTLLPMLAHTAMGAAALGHVGLAHGAIAANSATNTAAAAPGLSAAGGALAGAAIGFALTSTIMQYSGVGRGLSAGQGYGLMAAGAIGGAVAGYGIMGGTAFGASAATLTAIGLVAVGVVIAAILIMWAMGIGDVKEKDVKFTCQPWQPPVGGKDCSKCGSDGFPCSQYSCNSLGQECQIINEDDPATTACIDVSPKDSLAPVISPNYPLKPTGYTWTATDAGVRIEADTSDKCIQETYQAIPFGFILSEPGQCKVSTRPLTSFDLMDQYVSDNNRFSLNHTLPIILPNLESLGFESFDPNARANASVYVRCQDKSGNKNQRDYFVSFCIKQGPDITPPVITSREPAQEIVRYGQDALNATIYTNEPADCRWSTQDRNYSSMNASMSCLNQLGDMTFRGFSCSATFLLPQNQSTFFIRCLDQPWLHGENESKRNPTPVSYQYTVQKTATPLQITSITPNNVTLTFGTQPATVSFAATTAGGLDGTATCGFLTNQGLQVLSNTGTSSHSQLFNQMVGGTFKYALLCEDGVGNKAERNGSVIIKIDTGTPLVTRLYRDGNTLFAITSEPGTCVFGTDTQTRCRYNFSNATQLSGTALIHTTLLDEQSTYYIKCSDQFNNGNASDSCGAIVRGSRL